jgi:hypothetical protein
MASYKTDVTFNSSLTAYPSAPYKRFVFSLICALVAWFKLGAKTRSDLKPIMAIAVPENMVTYPQAVCIITLGLLLYIF